VSGTIARCGVLGNNSLTLLNTDLLFATGLLVGIALIHHTAGGKIAIHSALSLLTICGLAFLVVQCDEYQHLYWSLFGSGLGCLFFVVTGLHGAHVAIGVCLLAVYWLTLFWYSLFGADDFCTVCGVLGVMMYWHFVDLV